LYLCISSKQRQFVALIMHPADLSIQDFTYTLPEDRIAKYPLSERDASRLLIYKDGKIAEDTYKNISTHLPANSLLVFNNTKVVEARLLFQKPTGGVIEIFCLEPGEQYSDITTAMLQQGKVYWQCLVGGASKWKHGQVLEKKINNDEFILHAAFIEKKAGSFIIELSWTPSHLSFAEVLHYAGAIPLPPYIKREAEETDKTRYQTIYAQQDGSVAAPTAGLHITDTVVNQLDENKIHTEFVTLHFGAGTFKPVKAATMKDHDMHAEYIDVSRKTIENLLQHTDDPIIAVGTTSLRTIESLYWLGEKSAVGLPIAIGTAGSLLTVGQWEPYENNLSISSKEALLSLLDWMDKSKMERLLAKTQIIIAPGYKPRIVKALITNFHQPQSTSLLLVAALIGTDWRKVYDYALQHDFRFLSYGDGCLLWAKE
jgi:S-adenosylmethionine:tRNA ribosyltransferase-isomerase